MRRRTSLLQLALFLVIALGCSYVVATSVLGPRALDDPVRVTVLMPDTGGLDEGSQVTYRGVQVGEVSELRIEPGGGGVRVRLDLDPDRAIPADTTAVVTMDSPIAILRLDLRPRSDGAPFLRDGSVITAEHTRRPLPLEELLTNFMSLADSLPTEDLGVLADALATGLNGKGPQLGRIIDNTGSLLRTLRERLPQLKGVAGNTRTFLGPDGATGDRLRKLAEGMRALTGGLRETTPSLRTVLHEVPGPARQVARLMADNQPALTTLLGNLVTTSQLVSVRAPALEQALISLPSTLRELGGIVHGDTADFYLVGTQGPVCYNDTDRRPPTATEPRVPVLSWHCPASAPTLQQRGAANAPRPAPSQAPAAQAPGTYDPATGAPLPFDLGSGGQASVLGPRSWTSLLLRGVS